MLLALGMLISGSLNTITTSWADKQFAEGTVDTATIWAKMQGETARVHKFDHPFFQAMGMFVGEFLCMIVYSFTRRKAAALAAVDPSVVVPGGRTKGALWFSIPAALDILGTGTMYTGLCLTSASVFQMLRGASIVFTCVLSVLLLKRRIYAFQWVSVGLVIAGILVVGYVSIQSENAKGSDAGGGSGDAGTVILGDLLIIVAQLATAFQMVIEEKLLDKYPSASLKVVGLEGFFGFWILGIVLIPMYYIRPGGYPIENTPDALHQIANNWRIPLAMAGNALSIAFFNFFGITVTQQLSASHRMVLDSVRTVLVWACSLCLGWESFHYLQLVGFFFLTLGTAGYNKIFRLPGFTYPAVETAASPETLVSLQAEGARDRGESNLSASYRVDRMESELSTSLVRSLVQEESGSFHQQPSSASFSRK